MLPTVSPVYCRCLPHAFQIIAVHARICRYLAKTPPFAATLADPLPIYCRVIAERLPYNFFEARSASVLMKALRASKRKAKGFAK